MLTIKTAAFAAGLLTLLPITAQAADLSMPVAANTLPDAGLALAGGRWTGFYVGGNVGYGTTDDFKFNDAYSGVTGGIQAGYLHQMDMFVLGAEVEANFMDNLHHRLNATSGLNQTWSLAAKARAGVALDNTLIYGLAGYGVTQFGSYGGTVANGKTNGGLVFGAGVEQAVTDAISIRGEYQQTRYWDVTSTVGGVARKDNLTSHAFNVGANFRF